MITTSDKENHKKLILTLRTCEQRASTAAGDQEFPTEFFTRILEIQTGNNPRIATIELKPVDKVRDLQKL